VAPPDSVRELLSPIYVSEARSYLLTIVLCVVLCIFVGGLLCWHVTKRVAQPIKNQSDSQQPISGRQPANWGLGLLTAVAYPRGQWGQLPS